VKYISEERTSELIAAIDAFKYFNKFLNFIPTTGKCHMALCPFHKEKTPSFCHEEGSGLYYCYGCGAAGNVFTFTMKLKKIDFMNTARYLSNYTGISLKNSLRSNTEEKKNEISRVIISGVNYRGNRSFTRAHKTQDIFNPIIKKIVSNKVDLILDSININDNKSLDFYKMELIDKNLKSLIDELISDFIVSHITFFNELVKRFYFSRVSYFDNSFKYIEEKIDMSDLALKFTKCNDIAGVVRVFNNSPYNKEYTIKNMFFIENAL
jgi:hypothetical protein